MGVTAVVAIAAIGTAYSISSAEQAKKKAKEQEKAANAQQEKVEEADRYQKKVSSNNEKRDKVRALQERNQAANSGRGSTILTNQLGSAAPGAPANAPGVGAATSTGAGKTLLGM